MTTEPVTFVNVFEVEPAQQTALVAILTEALEQVIRHRPGFVAARLLVATDGRSVINEATWTDPEAVAATRDDPAAAEFAARAAALAASRPGIYRVHGSFAA